KWYAPWLEIAYKQGIVKGYDDGTFRPFDNVTRLEVIVMLYRAYLLTK
ncbi:MAG: S-layer homology domain-containing protein, partial [Dictyoglomi bacterium]|nr:S-layer homology domain-containing protein [Dictyoglomota bacterium]